ncbi:MAG: hypothetical protein IT532_04835 [Burkholderiales bacterium]|nr:hypothetical protein [Burkholderiales bacterium]
MIMDRRNALIAVMGLVIAALIWALVFYARDEFELVAEKPEEEIEVPSAVSEEGGHATITLSLQSQEVSGLRTVALRPAQSEGAADVYGVVVNVQPLYEQRGRYLTALAEARGLRAAVATSEAEYERARRLFSDDRNVAERVVQAAEAQWRADLARLQAAEQSARSTMDSMRATWGAAIAGWATDPSGTSFNALASQQSVIVQVAFPHELQAAAGNAPLTIAPVSARGATRPARFLSASPQTDAGLPGATFFYVVDGQGLRAGMRVAGALRLGGKARDGVAVPEAAVVWHGGKAWAYVKEDDKTFVRRLVSTDDEIGDAWFNVDGFKGGDEVVVSGAQLLLSEELKFQIRNENED